MPGGGLREWPGVRLKLAQRRNVPVGQKVAAQAEPLADLDKGRAQALKGRAQPIRQRRTVVRAASESFVNSDAQETEHRSTDAQEPRS